MTSAAKASRPRPFHFCKRALGNYKPALPVTVAVEHHHDPSADKAADDLCGVGRLARQAKPQHVDRRTQLFDLQTRAFAHHRLAAVGADNQVSANFQLSCRRPGLGTDNAVSFFDQIGDFRLHFQIEGRIARGVFVDEIQKVPLRHEREELAVRRQMRKVSERNRFIADLPGDLAHFLMRPFEKIFEDAQLVHQLERGRMNRVAAKVAQKIRVLLEHDDFDARARQQKAEHHSRRPTAGDAQRVRVFSQGILVILCAHFSLTF